MKSIEYVPGDCERGKKNVFGVVANVVGLNVEMKDENEKIRRHAIDSPHTHAHAHTYTQAHTHTHTRINPHA